MTLIVTVQEDLRARAKVYAADGQCGIGRDLNFAADCIDKEVAKIAKLEADLAAITALHASAIADGLAMAKQIADLGFALNEIRTFPRRRMPADIANDALKENGND